MSAEQEESLTIKVIDSDDGSETIWEVSYSTELGWLMDNWCFLKGKEPFKVRFLCDGQQVYRNDTANTVSICVSQVLK